ncbi:MAG: ketoacyl-ACP synthase III [Muribaculaceae bacterium]|jgi:3-oxoacyl-[acyl-carrier-protein] synthase-3|nr:ketoacyl-ACP synthase III [Muribaculaceae bacterium]MBQ1797952.1 ketoacyl-ACP synthase III [Muribaculaceae bacterium]MBQ4006327.1 ketoacyl-ACP synthase III [Muribaculaceae bacterium]
MRNAKITGVASYIPDYVLTNEELSHMVETNDEWITTRVGIKERRILKKDVGSSYMGIQAVNKLLASTGTSPDEVDLLICATSNPDYRFPSTASVIAHGCGMESKCYGYDIQAACAGFIVASYDASAYIKAGLYKKVVVVCTEKMSSMTNYEDRQTCPLFGDAAAAVLMEPTDEGDGIIDGIFHVDGSGLEHLVYKAGGSAKPASHESIDAREHFVYQEGRAVYKHAVMDMLTSSQDVMDRNGITVDDIQWFVPHQANLRIIEAVGSRLGIDPEKVLVNIEYRGNTSAASIPLCLDENKHRLHKGDKIVLTAFGAGFTWGAEYLIWSI